MISIEELHPDFARDCRSLQVGESAYSRRAEIPYDIHRYRDGWHIYWKSPPNGRIGRRLWLASQLDAFLTGNWRVGLALHSPHITRAISD
jgi:hypothetical protein